MSRHNTRPWKMITIAVLLAMTAPAWAQQESNMPSTADRPMHGESARQHDDASPPSPEFEPAIPEGMTLDDVFDYAETPPPEDYPQVIKDDEILSFTLVEQLEHRVSAKERTRDQLGWEAQGWIGSDYDKFWWKNEGEAVFEGAEEGETETDLLYSRLITPFWNVQLGAQYANEWESGRYDDRWSGVIALQGLAPYKFELDNSLYVSENGDFTFEFEAEYDIRITQRLVLQPRTELGFAFQDIPERDLGAGMTDANFDLRLRYEIKRECAPYIGMRYRTLVGETSDIAKAAGRESEQLFVFIGVRFAM